MDGGAFTKEDRLAALARSIEVINATLEAFRIEVHILLDEQDALLVAEQPTDDEWAQYEAMRAAEEIAPRRERFDDEVADRLDAIEDRHIHLSEVTR